MSLPVSAYSDKQTFFVIPSDLYNPKQQEKLHVTKSIIFNYSKPNLLHTYLSTNGLIWRMPKAPTDPLGNDI